jgi:transcriptional antiterminator RfaH
VKTINPRARKIRPYFPGYLFVNIESGSAVTAELHWLPGVAGWVRFGDEPAVVPESVVNGIRRHVDELNANEGETLLKRINHGEEVEILEGPFARYKAMFDAHISGNERVRVLLKMVNSKQVPVEMPARLLRIKKRG